MRLDDARFTVTQVAEATGLSGNILRSWLQRGYVKLLPKDVPAETSGVPRLLSQRSALRIGVMARLVGHGIGPTAAAAAALAYADVGGEDMLSPTRPYRAPGCLFPDRWTVLCYTPEATWIRHAPDKLSWAEITLLPSSTDRLATVVELDRLHNRIITTLASIGGG